MSTRADKLAYFVALGLITCLALIAIDLGIKNDLIKHARALKEAIDGQGQEPICPDCHSRGTLRGGVLGDVQDSDGTLESGDVLEEIPDIPIEPARPVVRRTRNRNPAISDGNLEVGS